MSGHQILRAAGAALAPLTRANIGYAATKATEWAVATYKNSGTGTPIALLKGIAKSNAIKAALAGGPIAKGGHGVAGGKKVLLAIWITANASLTLAGGTIVHLRSKLMAKGENVASCLSCRTLFSATKGGDLEGCPNCAQGNRSEV